MNDLKRCPFCGSDKLGQADYAFFIYCVTCGANSGGSTNYEEGRKKWNKRIQEPPMGDWIQIVLNESLSLMNVINIKEQIEKMQGVKTVSAIIGSMENKGPMSSPKFKEGNVITILDSTISSDKLNLIIKEVKYNFSGRSENQHYFCRMEGPGLLMIGGMFSETYLLKYFVESNE